MKLTLVRHGETEENKVQIIQGQTHGTLTELGVEQAKKLALRLKDEKFDHIYISDLGRAVNTAKEILKFHPTTNFTYIKELREISLGVFEGKSYGEPTKERNRLGIPFAEFRPINGESKLDVQQRMLNFYNKIVKQHKKDEHVLFVCHGTILTSLYLHLLNKECSFEDYEKHHPNNAAVSVIEINDSNNPNDVKFSVFNCTKHLEGQLQETFQNIY